MSLEKTIRSLKRVCMGLAVVGAVAQTGSVVAATVHNCGGSASDFGLGCSLAELYTGGTIFVDEIGFIFFPPLPPPNTPPLWTNPLGEKFPGRVDPRFVEVVGVESGLDVGLQFLGHGEFYSLGIENTYTFQYRVLQAFGAGPLDSSSLRLRGLGDASDIEGFSFAFKPGEGGRAAVRVTERVLGLAEQQVGAEMQEGGALVKGLQNSFAFAAPETRELNVVTQVAYSGQELAGGPVSAASVDFFYETFRRVPEPGTLALVAIAALALATERKRRV